MDNQQDNSLESRAAVAQERPLLHGINLDAHLEGVGEPGSFRVMAERRGSAHFIASVKVTDGRPSIFIDEVTLRLGASRAMREAGITNYDAFRKAVVDQLLALSKRSPSTDTAAALRWPWKCVFYCPQHEECENYDWIGFW